MTASVEQGIDKITHIPPLENGDRLTRHEFERRYTGMPHIKKAELIEGIVYMASPVRHKSHGRPHAAIIAWLSAYWLATPGVELSDNATVRLDADNEPQPDVLLRIQSGGSSRISEDDYIEGTPELIVEVAATSAANDLYDKKKVYRRNGVKEYIIWQTLENEINWFSLQEGEYILLEADARDVIKSQIYPGLWLDVAALKAGNMLKVSTVLQQGLSSSEHKAFVQQLAQD